MRKLFKFVYILGLLFSVIAIASCTPEESNNIETITLSDKESKVMERLSNNEIVVALSKDTDFRGLSDMISFFENMPNKKYYLQNFDREILETQEDDSYFISLSGYSETDVANARTKVNKHMEAIFQKFPQIKEYSQEQLRTIIESASNIYYDTLFSSSKIKCSTCGKIGRSKMIFYTATGAATCGAFGGPFALYTGWICATAGFATAGYETFGCLEDCQK